MLQFSKSFSLSIDAKNGLFTDDEVLAHISNLRLKGPSNCVKVFFIRFGSVSTFLDLHSFTFVFGDQFGMGEPTSSYGTAGTAPRTLKAAQLPHHYFIFL